MPRLTAMIVSSALLVVLTALADGWVHSPDRVRVDRIAQPLPHMGVDLVTGKAISLHDSDPTACAIAGWYRVIPATLPDDMRELGRFWTVTNLVAVETIVMTNKLDWMREHGMVTE